MWNHNFIHTICHQIKIYSVCKTFVANYHYRKIVEFFINVDNIYSIYNIYIIYKCINYKICSQLFGSSPNSEF